MKNKQDAYKLIFEESPVGLFVSTPDGKFLTVNQQLADMFGYTKEELLKLGPIALYSDPQERKLFQTSLEGKGKISHETRFKTKNGTLIYCEERARVWKDERNGQLYGYVGMIVDINDKKQNEAQAAHEKNLRIIGMLASTIVHNLNNLITVMQGNLDLMRHILNPDNPLNEYINRMTIAQKDASEMIESLLEFNKPKMAETEIFDVNEELNQYMHFIKNIFEDKPVEVTLRLAARSFIQFNVSGLRQILLNLAKNSSEAMNGNTNTFTISTENVVITEPIILQRTAIKKGGYCLIRVEDSGAGIPEEIKEKIFDPFFTTKAKGTGLGLATVYKMIKDNGGYITVDSVVGKGTTFVMYFPLHME
ncbi:MAG: ATP-binding protein [bacterium]